MARGRPDLIEQHGLRIIVGGQVHTVLGWLSALPDALIRARPLLCIFHALALLFTNELAAAEARLQDAERCIRPDTPAAEVQLIQGRAAAIRANIARYTGDLAGCVAYGTAGAAPAAGDRDDCSDDRLLACGARLPCERRCDGRRGTTRRSRRLRRSAPRGTCSGRWRRSPTWPGCRCCRAGSARRPPPIARWPRSPMDLTDAAAAARRPGLLSSAWASCSASGMIWTRPSGYLAQAMEQLPDRLTVDAEDVALGYLALARLQHARGEHATAQRTLESLHGPGPPARLCRPPDRARGGGAGAARAWRRQPRCRRRLGGRERPVTPSGCTQLPARSGVPDPGAGVDCPGAATSGSGSMLPQALDLLDRLLEDATAKARMGSVIGDPDRARAGSWAQEARADALATIRARAHARRARRLHPPLCG